MADIAMCSNLQCSLSPTCFRFNAISRGRGQSFLTEPKKDCENENYKLYWKMDNLNGQSSLDK